MSDKIFKYKIIVEAVDKPLKSMQGQLKSINDIFKKQTDQIKKTTGAVGNLANTYKKFEIGKLAISGLGTAMSGVAGIAGKGIDLMKDFGASAVDAMQFRERAVFSLGRAFGDGSKKLQEVIDLANRTTLDTKPMVNMANALSTSFKHWDDVKKIMVLGGDVLYQFPELEQQFTSAFQKAGSGGMLEAGSDLLKAISGGYIGYKREIAKQLGLKGKDLDNITKVDDLIKAAKKNGKLTGRELTRALVESLKGGLKMQNIGDNTIGAAQKSLVGAISNFKSSFESLLITVPWEKYTGIGNLATFLNNITQSLNSQEVRDAIGNAFNDIFAPLKQINESGLIEKFFTQKLPPLIQSIGKQLKDAFGWFTDLITGKVSIGSSLKSVFMKVVNTLKDILIYIGELVGAGIKAALYGKGKGAPIEVGEGIKAQSKEEAIRIATGYVNSGGSSFKDSIKNAVEVKSYDPEFNLYFGNSVKKEDAEHIAKTVADKVKESIDSKARAASELRKSGGKS